MPRFRDNPPPEAISNGVYAAKVLTAKTGISARGNEYLTMRLELCPSKERISSTLTFVAGADTVISCFCSSIGLLRPARGAEYDLTPTDVIGRHLYIIISSEPDPDTGDLVAHVVRFVTRDDAIRRNPAISEIQLQPQEPLRLKPVTDERGIL